jgi:hypothetical protein
MNEFTFKKGRPVFGHNTKRSRPEAAVDLRENYMQDNLETQEDLQDVGFDLDLDYRNPEDAEDPEETKDAEIDSCLERIDDEVIQEQEELLDNQFNALLLGAKLLQGFNVTVNISPKI